MRAPLIVGSAVLFAGCPTVEAEAGCETEGEYVCDASDQPLRCEDGAWVTPGDRACAEDCSEEGSCTWECDGDELTMGCAVPGFTGVTRARA